MTPAQTIERAERIISNLLKANIRLIEENERLSRENYWLKRDK